jgi:hypothetical protein
VFDPQHIHLKQRHKATQRPQQINTPKMKAKIANPPSVEPSARTKAGSMKSIANFGDNILDV